MPFDKLRDRASSWERAEAGVTLVEMTVVLAILAGIVAGITTAIIMGFRTLTENSMRLDATGQSKVAIEAITKTLRTAIIPSQLKGTCDTCDNAAFITGNATSVSFYANVDSENWGGAPSKVAYSLANGDITETITRPEPHAADDYNFGWCENGETTCEVRTRVVARDVAQAGAALFTYYDRAGATLPVPLDANETRLRSVDSVDLVLKVRLADRVGTATTSTRVTLPNADSLIQPSATPSP